MLLRQKNPVGILEAGTDEVGRGCLAGPVTAAAIILPYDYYHPLIKDSKKLGAKNRYLLRRELEKEALTYGVCHISHTEIDQINILNASIKAMHGALKLLNPTPDYILVDGNRFHPYQDIPHQCIIKGDNHFLNIAAASILAKTYRDELMITLHQKYPEYEWGNNKGYPTQQHRAAIRNYGLTPYHRKSFKQLPTQLEFNW